MSTLRELSGELLDVRDLALDPDVPSQAIADTLDGMEGLFNDKAISVVHVIVNSDGDIAALESEINRLSERKSTSRPHRIGCGSISDTTWRRQGINKITSPLFTITLAAGRDVVCVSDESALPDDFVRVKTTIAPDKVAILPH